MVAYFKVGVLFAALFSLPAAGAAAEAPNEGDTRSAKFVLPFSEALKLAKKEKRLILLKPIYGGVDQLGEKDYRCGSW